MALMFERFQLGKKMQFCLICCTYKVGLDLRVPVPWNQEDG